MAGLDQHWVSLIVFLPLLWAIAGLVLPGEKTAGGAFSKYWALLGSIATFGLSLFLYQHYLPSGPDFQFVENHTWIPGLGISYAVGIDGISFWLILLTTFLMPLAVLCSFTAVETRTKEYYFLLLALETGMLGAFVALDIFLFYVFWEAMLIPMYLLIGIWGGKDRIYAAMKFFLYTMVGSLLMLVAIFYLAYQHKLQMGSYSTLITDLYSLHLAGGAGFWTTQNILFLAFALAFAIKVPLFPFSLRATAERGSLGLVNPAVLLLMNR